MTVWHRKSGGMGRVEWGSVGWEREAVQREGPCGPGLLSCRMKVLDLSMSNVSLYSKSLS